MQDISIHAPAKINLYLAVTAKEDNGYHTVETVMHAISLFDLVTVERLPFATSPITLTCDSPAVPCDASNLAYRAAVRYFEKTGNAFPIRIHIEKRIPVAGGLAGGSTDAAAVLVALNRLTDIPLSEDDLLSVGASLGADVPFCVLACRGTSCARGLHYGEQMTPCPSLEPLFCVVASSGEAVSTPWAYAQIDAHPYTPENGYLPLYDALHAHDTNAVLSHMYNGFEDVILPLRPGAAHCKALLSDADRVMMSGSGPTIIALYRNEADAHAAERRITAHGDSAVLAKLL